MMNRYILTEGTLTAGPNLSGPENLPQWFDLLTPTDDERSALAAHLGLTLPTRDDMAEIEVSSRLYSEGGATFMTAMIPSMIPSSGDGDEITLGPITFILTGHTPRQHLITLRDHDPRPFAGFVQRTQKSADGMAGAEDLLVALLDAVIGRLADILERAGRDIDAAARDVFGRSGAETRDTVTYKSTLQRIGRAGDLTSGIKESLNTLERLIVYLRARPRPGTTGTEAQIDMLARDIASLQEQSGFMSQKTTFLLDATLGLINIEQNAIIKIFSVVSVIFLPPTLVASVYGMNFRLMPELDWALGYPIAVAVMVLSAVLPFAYFKRRGWL